MVPSWINALLLTLAALLPLIGLGVVGVGARAAGDRHPWTLGVTVTLVLAAWGAACVFLAPRVAMADGEPRWFASIALLVGWVTAITLIVVAARRSARLRAALATRAALWRLTSFEIARNVGVIFLVLHSQGDLAGLFAYPAAWGDIAIGMTAVGMTVVVLVHYERLFDAGSRWRQVFIAWNVLGIADMIMAISLGLTLFPGALQLINTEPATDLFGELPLVLFPTFLVPFATAIHVVMLDVIWRPPVITTDAVEPSMCDEHAAGST